MADLQNPHSKWKPTKGLTLRDHARPNAPVENPRSCRPEIRVKIESAPHRSRRWAAHVEDILVHSPQFGVY